MKYLIISDTHLDKEFDKKKLDFLVKIIKDSDRVIIAGDFWEGLQMTFDEFIKSEWNKLFPVLKSKKTVYVYGNHDPQKKCDERVSLFSTEQTNQYSFQAGKKTFFVEHGHRARILGVVVTGTISAIIQHLTKRNPQISHHMEKFAFKTFGKDFHQFLSNRMSNTIKKQLTKDLNSDEILICGHSHHQEKDVKNKYVGSGLIDFGIAQYVTVENGSVRMHEQLYK